MDLTLKSSTRRAKVQGQPWAWNKCMPQRKIERQVNVTEKDQLRPEEKEIKEDERGRK